MRFLGQRAKQARSSARAFRRPPRKVLVGECLEERVVLYHHVFRNSLLALITVAASILPTLMGGSVIVESIFSIPGMGRVAWQSVQFRDREVVLAVTLIGGLIGLFSQVLRDILYALADPRVRYD